MRYLKPFTFYPGEWAATLVSDGTLQVNLCVDALWDALELPGEAGCDLETKIEELEDEIVDLHDQISDLRDENKQLSRLEDENETLKEQIATLLEKLNGR